MATTTAHESPEGRLSAAEREEFIRLITLAVSQNVSIALEQFRMELRTELRSLGEGIQRLDSRVERQEARLSAIESFPRLPLSQPPRHYGTEAQSVSNPKRVRAGYAG